MAKQVKLLPLPYHLQWINRVLVKKLLNTALPAHILILGQTESGKTYLMLALIEMLFRLKTHKFFLLNCYEQPMIEEALGLFFPNTNNDDIKKTAKFRSQKYLGQSLCKAIYPNNVKPSPQKINLKVYVPLTPNLLPDKLPAIFEPFTIPTNDLSEQCVQILYGDVDIQKIYQLYDSKIRKGRAMSLPKMKREFFKMEFIRKQAEWVKSIGDTTTVAYNENAAYHTLRHFQTRLNYFDRFGILSSPKNTHCLKKILEKDIKDLNTISILDLSWLKENKMMQFFCLLYFLKAIENTIDKIDVMPFKVAPVVDEAREIMAKGGEGKRGYHTGLQDYINELLAAARKRNEEIWLSSQTPSNLKDSTFKNMKIKIVTHLDDPKDIDWLCSNFRDCKRWEIQGLLERMSFLREYKNDYRFILVGEATSRLDSLDSQLSGRNIQDPMDIANCLPHPRTNMYYRTEHTLGGIATVFRPSIKDNYKTIIEQLKAEGHPEPEKNILPTKKELIDEWRTENEEIKEEIARKLKEKQEKRKKEREETEKKLKEIANARKRLTQEGKRDDNLAKLSQMTGISREKIRAKWIESNEFM